MKHAQLPGAPTIVGLMLIVLIGIWLGVSGPLNLSVLKEWQTLVSATVAATGIGIAAYIAVRKPSNSNWFLEPRGR
jgi:hypothetical protein